MSENITDRKLSAAEIVWNILKEDKVFVAIVSKTFNSETVTDEKLKEQFCNHPAIYLGLARQHGYDKTALKKYIKLIFDDSVKKILEKNQERKIQYLKHVRRNQHA